MEEREASAGEEQQFPMFITDIPLFDHSQLENYFFFSFFSASGGMKRGEGVREERDEIRYGVLDLNPP